MTPLVIFDFDGTIADSRYAIGRTAQVALEHIGEDACSSEAFEARIGLPLAQIFDEVVPDLAPERRAAAVVAYRQLYAEISGAHTKVFDGMLDLLDALRERGTRLAIATGKSTRGAHKAITRLDLDRSLFELVIGTDAVDRPKPHPDMVTHICTTLAVPPADAIVVGDTVFDVEMSNGAGSPACAVTWGSHARDALEAAGAKWVVDTRDELSRLLL